MNTILLTAALLLCFALPPAASAQDAAKPAALYDAQANGANQIKSALKTAQRQHKNVLVQFGANWCGWCHKLHTLMANDPKIAANLKRNYVTVLIDVDKGHNADIVQRYGSPTKFGLPVLVVLNAQGRQLTTQDTGKLEQGDRHSPQKVQTFLSAWTPKK